MKGKQPSTASDRMARNISPELYSTIRTMWDRHVELEVAEGKLEQAVEETMAEDCVYELLLTGERWEGHTGAMDFYDLLNAAFPTAEWELLDICIGPQGVLGIANMTAKMEAPFGGFDETGKEVHWRIINMFEWDPDAEKFHGERLHYFGPWPPSTP